VPAQSSSWPYARWLAHRGGGALAPENTLAAFDVGLAYGYRAAEVDAVLSADEVPVLLHDATLERTTDGLGSIADKTALELAALDAGSWFDGRFVRVGLPTLVQALQHCWERGIWLNVEIKPVAGHEQTTGRVVAQTIAAFCAEKRRLDPIKAKWFSPLLSSFAPEALAAARAVAPELRRGLLYGRVPNTWASALRALDAYSLHCDHRRLTRSLAGKIGQAGVGLLCYTVNDPARAAELRRWGVDAICTDRIDLIRPQEEAGPYGRPGPQPQ
jgi:glycerophosphoryl diester phosphodiesterase